MLCPNCGEPVQTRHSFCVICGADLIDVPTETPLQAVVAKAGAAGKRVQAVLTAPIGTPKQELDPAEAAGTAQEAAQPAQGTEMPQEPVQDDHTVIPDFMRQFLT